VIHRMPRTSRLLSLAAIVGGIGLSQPCAAEPRSCSAVDCKQVRLLAKRPANFPVRFVFQDVEFVIALDDCLGLVRDPTASVPVRFHKVFDYYGVVREVLPPGRTIDLVEPSADEIDSFLGDAFDRGIAYGYDRRIRKALSEVSLCRAGKFYPCDVDSKRLCGCAGFDYCLPDGRRLAAGEWVCA